jgi:predicted alpha/beta-fold hydrolase
VCESVSFILNVPTKKKMQSPSSKQKDDGDEHDKKRHTYSRNQVTTAGDDFDEDGNGGHHANSDGVVIERRKKTDALEKNPNSNILSSSSYSDGSQESSELGIMVEEEDVHSEHSPRHEEEEDKQERQKHVDNDESEEAYRLRVYGTTEKYNKDTANQHQQKQQPLAIKQSSLRRLSRQFSNALLRRQSSIVESLPETPAGWAVLVSAMASAALGYEIQLQKSLTCPPLVYGQCCCEQGPLNDIYKCMTATQDSILRRDIQPSLFVGTRGVVSSTSGYILGGPGATDRHVRFRQVLTMAQDGAEIALDWELPILKEHGEFTVEQRQQEIRNGPIQQPVVLILHGMNNDASFGYVKSMIRTCTDRGWIAVGMNFRGCAHGLPMSTPRGYSGAYTGDLRFVVQHICARLDSSVASAKLFLVGNSLGANLVCKCLGEEGLSGTLPKQVAGAVALGNPMSINATKMDPIMSLVLALGVKRTLVENWGSVRKFFRDSYYKSQILKAMGSLSLGASDDALSRIMIRNDSIYPFGVSVGYTGGGPDYSHDASSYRCCPYIPVPTLQIIASDDFLVGHTFKGKTYFSLANPNIMVVETKCGGHLGWQESPPPPPPSAQPGERENGSGGNSRYGLSSWSDAAAADFIQAIIETKLAHQPSAAAPISSSSSKDVDVHVSPGNAISSHDHYFIERPPINLRSRL